jgi:hypothetical protein
MMNFPPAVYMQFAFGLGPKRLKGRNEVPQFAGNAKKNIVLLGVPACRFAAEQHHKEFGNVHQKRR